MSSAHHNRTADRPEAERKTICDDVGPTEHKRTALPLAESTKTSQSGFGEVRSQVTEERRPAELSAAAVPQPALHLAPATDAAEPAGHSKPIEEKAERTKLGRW